MAANNGSFQSPPLNDKVLINPRLGIEVPLGLPEHLLQQEMTPPTVALDENNDNFGRFYRADVETLNDFRATITQLMKGSIEFDFQDSEGTDELKQFLIRMYGSNCEKRFLGYLTMRIEQLCALITGYGKLTSRMKRAWLNQFDSWSPSQLRAQIRGLTVSRAFLEIE